MPLIYYKPPELVLPKANLSINTSEGYAPYSVQFTDLSENETSRNWDFENDGTIDSSDEMPVFTYPSSGIYFVSLTASNENGTDIKTITIDVEENNVTEIQSGFVPREKSNDSQDSSADQPSGSRSISSMPGFEMIYGVFGLLSVLLHKKTAK
ncbi:hypothetical protein SDC9_155959 [bioreactor metagenome]|uniref:PKD domain-containing protein n=1 Tax=bioreactor metagenome TaxID=1076179 RepID=A0A645F7U0_9ZZZZ